MSDIMRRVKPLSDGLRESREWYIHKREQIKKKR